MFLKFQSVKSRLSITALACVEYRCSIYVADPHLFIYLFILLFCHTEYYSKNKYNKKRNK